jgi:hypothetical protein
MRIVQKTGRFLGTDLNDSGDAMAFYRFAERWSHLAHAGWAGGGTFADPVAEADFRAAVKDHRRLIDLPGMAWGWKQPRSIHFLPFLHWIYPDLRYLHVIRDGLDLSLGDEIPTRLGIGRRGNGVYSAARSALPPDAKGPDAVLMIRFWSVVNVMAADYGELELGPSYMRVRLEDLCDRTQGTVARIVSFAAESEAPAGCVDNAVAEVSRPESIGRARRHSDPELVEEARRAGEPALRRFGYARELLQPGADSSTVQSRSRSARW